MRPTSKSILVLALLSSLLLAPRAEAAAVGDCNGDGAISVVDVFCLANFLFASGAAPVGSGDNNSDGVVSPADLFFEINYLFAAGPLPGSPVPVRVTDFVGTVWSIALGVESTGQVHVLWTGERATDSTFCAFYSTSADGRTWSPYVVLDQGDAFDANVVVDDARGKVHLVYRSNTNGIRHRVVSSGIVSPATLIDVNADGDVSPNVGIDSTTGNLVVEFFRNVPPPPTGGTYKRLMYCSKWNGIAWSAATQLTLSTDVSVASLAVAPGGAVMLAWTEPSQTVTRTSLAQDGSTFGAVQNLSPGYMSPETDSEVVLGWSPLDARFHAVTDRLLAPGVSDIFHYVHDGASWTGGENISSSDTNFSSRPYFSSVATLPSLYYSWFELSSSNDPLDRIFQRTQTGTTLNPVEDISAYVRSSGSISFTGCKSSFLGPDGTPHLAIGEAAYAYLGVWYLRLQHP